MDRTSDLVFGPRARALAPRGLGSAPPTAEPWLFRYPREGNLLRVGFQRDCLEAPERQALEALEDARLVRGACAGGEEILVCPRHALAKLAMELPAAAVLLASWDLSLRPAGHPRIMGVINATPDSFSDGGEFADPGDAIARGRELVRQGADILDVGGESSRPGAEPVAEAEELARVVPVITGLADLGVPISIDTTKSRVAERALELGASWVNDISAGRADPAMLPTVSRAGCTYVVMHMRGSPRDMQREPRYGDVVSEVASFLRERAGACVAAGIALERILIDPGIGFGKLLSHNLELLRRLNELRSLGLPVLIGVSRKSFIAQAANLSSPQAKSLPAPRVGPAERVGGTAAAVTAAVMCGADVLRVHDVAVMAEATRVASALFRPDVHLPGSANPSQ